MYVVVMEYWPDGLRGQAQEVGRVVIQDDKTGNRREASYDVVAGADGFFGHRKGAWGVARVEKHQHGLSMYLLLSKALTALLDRKTRLEPSDEGHAFIDGTRRHGRTAKEQELYEKSLAKREEKKPL